MTLISTKENRLSFGIELEIIVCHKQERLWAPSENTKVSEEEEAVMPPVLEAPFEQRDTEVAFTDHENIKWIEGEVANIIKTVPGAKFKRGDWPLLHGEGPDLHPSVYISPRTAWEAKPDCSVVDDCVYVPLGYNATGIEVASPALWDCPEAHRHVQDVVAALSRNLRWRVNVRTGFHVHVGAGARQVVDPHGNLEWKTDKFDFKVLQRAAALIWAADHFLFCAHPPERQLNYYAQPIALASQLAVGQEHLRVKVDPHQADDADDGQPWARLTHWVEDPHTDIPINIADRFPNPTMPSRPPGVPGVEPPSTTLRPKFHGKSESSSTLFPSVRPSHIDGRAYDRVRPYLPAIKRQYIYDQDIKDADITIEKGIAYILHPNTRHKVAKLLSHEGNMSNRLNYNFTGYVDGGGRGYNTIEFREATGTLDPTTVAAWSSTCLAIFRFCTVANDASYWTTAWNLIDAHNAGLAGKPHNYDMISLMIDCGASSEAAFFEKSLRKLGDKHWYTSIQNNKRVIPDASLDGSPPQNRTNDMSSPVVDHLDNEAPGSSPEDTTTRAGSRVPSFFDSDFPVASRSGTAAAVSPPTPQQSQPQSQPQSRPQSQSQRHQQPPQRNSRESHAEWRPPRPSNPTSQTNTTLTDNWNRAVRETADGYRQRHEELEVQADDFDVQWKRLGLGKKEN
ncbi:hypothetical protein QBC36DRAFT_388472 [Triangularia setosa]|uniref:Uncharacterized protein n=1 Tax=Triangularia setosa TaxID=2587417 RepID=A0AAN6W682_9PEZI|nr:hypothetical protein QBC36DRAFT_388472 [Podospora setosa]